MIKNQNKSFYFICLFFFALNLVIQPTKGQNVSEELVYADSLFKAQKYTESFEIYSSILSENDLASPRMLLKMAFIKEGLGDFSNALYYLNLYYIKTSDKRARSKMLEIAEENDLRGFELSDGDFFLGLMRKYYMELNLLLLLIAMMLGAYMIYHKVRTGSRTYSTGFVIILILAISFYSINFSTEFNEAIVVENHSYIMSGPSAGADLIDVIKKGHRVKVYDQDGLWTSIDWNGKKAYVRTNKIRKIG